MLRPPEVPRWTQGADALFAAVSSRCRVIGCATPVNLRAEIHALTRDFEAGKARLPRFAYAPDDGEDPRPSLEAMAAELEKRGPLGELYAARAREMVLEAGLCRTAGADAFFDLAARRYGRRDDFDDHADSLVDDWVEGRPEDGGDAELVPSDDREDARSLLRLMQAEIGRRRLPVRVVVAERLASLAATGPGVIYVAKGKPLTEEDARRTVLHEIDGHAIPRLRAQEQPLGLFSRGTAHGSDEQEGRAIGIEEQHGLLRHHRRFELALRHIAGRSVRQGADFVETTRSLLTRRAPLRAALRIAARSHRGGGLARELVYVPAWLRVKTAVSAEPALDGVLARGQVSVDAAKILATWISPAAEKP
ncbi:MAG: DUF1704 domain-containing protein [Polyangiaceae bacterium]